ncbi:unnamed protein product [Bursaphelenchus okinawaensis]|uniref:Tyrosine-protein kinase n=1 Tax=Bursaphelenchus okinawaensis TaxID=465554 RepID=A0A811K577_9BILA|nr:unnamed protein product [Bursaphelenchus okinawaensis]CAG9091602.1 unnamed protein product [Bursaphelenchus okinawaensis]
MSHSNRVNSKEDVEAEAYWPKNGIDVLDPTLMRENYYHGLLPREDILEMLKENGDFLLRLSEPEPDKPRQLILSAMQDKEEGTDGIRHFVIAKTDDGFVLDNNNPFPTVPEMIKFFIIKKINISERFPLRLVSPQLRKPWQLNHTDIVPGKKLGEGQFGEVLEGKLIKNGKKIPVAIKVTKTESMTKEQIKELMSEARIMRSLHHPHVVRFYGVGAFQEPLLVIMELVDEGALDAILKKKSLDVHTKSKYCLHASYGITYLHGKNLLHRDIAARNCLVGGGKLKMSDFGMTRRTKVYRMDRKKKIPLRWAAPEALKTGRYTAECDVYSWGVLCWEIFSDGQEPYGDTTMQEIGRKIKNGEQLIFPPSAPKFLVRLIIQRVWCSAEHRYMQSEVTKQLEKLMPMLATSALTTLENEEPGTEGRSGKERPRTKNKKKNTITQG